MDTIQKQIRQLLGSSLICLVVSCAFAASSAAMQSGKDLSELYDTFWHLQQIQGSTQDLSHVVIDIDQTGIHFSTPSYSLSMLLQYDLQTGLTFFTTYAKGGDSKSGTYIHDQQVANAFENALRKIASYETKQGNLTFYDKDRQPLFVLNPIKSTGIENRKWRIAKYRGFDSPQTDKDGLIDAKEDASIIFSNGRVGGSPGGGMWAGTYNLSGDELAFDGGFWYEGAWSEEQLEQGYAVSKAFKGDRRIEQRGNQILLRDKSGQAQILLVPF